MNRLFECGVMLRIYTMLMSGLYAYTGLAEELSNTYRVAHADQFAYATTVGLAVFALLGTIDLFVNDLMPERFVIARALHDRHLVNMAISCCFGILMWTCVKYRLPTAILPFYAVYVVMVPAAAFADVRKRFKQK
jgi:hypothetical protein